VILIDDDVDQLRVRTALTDVDINASVDMM